MLLLLFVKKGGFNFGYLNLSLFKSFKKSNVELPLENKTDFGFKINLNNKINLLIENFCCSFLEIFIKID